MIGSRQIDKSSLMYLMIKHLISVQSVNVERIFSFNLDDLKLRELFENIAEFVQFIRPGAEKKFIFINEIQRLENPGLFLKELYDLNLNLKIVYSGSSQLEIKSKMKENLAKSIKIHRNEVEKYITVLERTFIIRRIYPFFENYKKEITKTPKVYFLDLGLRNFILNNFNSPEMRNDIGELFENFFLIELIHGDQNSAELGGFGDFRR